MTIDRETVIRLADESGMLEPIEFGVDALWVANAEDLERFAALVLEHGRKPLTDEQIAKCLRATLPRTKCTTGYVAFARAVEREATVQMPEQIKADEALMQKVLHALPSAIPCNEFHHNAKDRHRIGEPCKPAQRYVEAFYAILQRLEAKK